MSLPQLLIPNLGAEEGYEPHPLAGSPALRRAVSLWRLLFAPNVLLDSGTDHGTGEGPDHETGEGPDHETGEGPDRETDGGTGNEPLLWPDDLGPRPDAAVFPWLEAPGQATAWLATPAARARAQQTGRVLSGAAPERVARVHDKAFAHRVALEEELGARELREAALVLEPEELTDPAALQARIAARMADWPSWLREAGATLKPRFGSSGRGRVALDSGGGDPETLRSALPRLAARGGALLEPWLSRQADLSAVLYVDESGSIVMLGTLEQRVTADGTCRGHRGTLDGKGRVTSASDFDEALREAAVTVAAAASREGFRGPCGLDALVYSGADGSPQLRPVVEFNARFTLGLVSVGLARRAHALLKRRLGLGPGDRRLFELALEAPADSAPEASEALLALGPPVRGRGPALAVAAADATRPPSLLG